MTSSGGYLLFKIFYKPFGTYPRYSYFKQVCPLLSPSPQPWPDPRAQSTADPIPGGTSPGVSPGVSPASKTIPLVSTPPTSSSSSTEPPSSASPSLRLRKNASQAASTDSSSATSPGQKFLSVKNGGGSGDEEDEKRQRIQRAQSIGFEGPMLESDDLRSPSGSEVSPSLPSPVLSASLEHTTDPRRREIVRRRLGTRLASNRSHQPLGRAFFLRSDDACRLVQRSERVRHDAGFSLIYPSPYSLDALKR